MWNLRRARSGRSGYPSGVPKYFIDTDIAVIIGPVVRGPRGAGWDGVR